MKGLFWIIIAAASNFAALVAAARLVPGFKINGDYQDVIIASLIFALLNLTAKPLLKFLLTPLIILSLGFGIILLNALMLYLLTILTKTITIEGTLSLFFATVVVSFVNFSIHLLAKRLLK